MRREGSRPRSGAPWACRGGARRRVVTNALACVAMLRRGVATRTGAAGGAFASGRIGNALAQGPPDCLPVARGLSQTGCAGRPGSSIREYRDVSDNRSHATARGVVGPLRKGSVDMQARRSRFDARRYAQLSTCPHDVSGQARPLPMTGSTGMSPAGNGAIAGFAASRRAMNGARCATRRPGLRHPAGYGFAVRYCAQKPSAP